MLAFQKKGFSTSLYLWTAASRGVNTKQSQDIKARMQIPKGTPTRIEAFDDLGVEQISTGIRHSGVITKEGDLYTFGSGNWGVLGHGNEKDIRHDQPRLVEYFKERDIKIKDVSLGDYHTIALDTKGDVYTWGYGGKKGMFNWMYSQEVGALGHGDKEAVMLPKKVKFFKENNIKVKQVAGGLYHNLVLTECNKIYIWGRGLYGVLGNGSNNYALEPELNQEIEGIKEEYEDKEGGKIVKIDAADDYSTILTANGDLYAWGKNDRGQMGVGSGFGIDMVESEAQPTQVKCLDEKEKEIGVVDNYCGQNTMFIRTEDNKLHKTGLKLDYTPKRLDFSKEFDMDKIQHIACGSKHFAVNNTDGLILTWGNVFKSKSDGEVEGFQIYRTDDMFEEGSIKDLSLRYGVYAAVVEHK